VVLNPNAAESTLVSHGEFEVDSVSHGEFAGEPYGLHPDLYRCLNALRSDFVRPIGELTLGWRGRWSDPRIDQIVSELELTPWDNEERIIELGTEALKITMEEMIAIPVFSCPITIVFDEYYWTNWPSPENDWARCDVLTTWPELKYALHNPKPTGQK
jgi:peptide/nickel transport system substrate-binding protein